MDDEIKKLWDQGSPVEPEQKITIDPESIVLDVNESSTEDLWNMGKAQGDKGLQKPTDDELMKNITDPIKTVGMGAVQGLSSGSADELGGGAIAAFDEIVNPEGDFLDKYTKWRDKIREVDKEAQEYSPLLYGASGFVGGMINPLARVPGMQGSLVKNVPMLTKGLRGIVSKGVEGAARGAGAGALAAIGVSEADLIEAYEKPEKREEIVNRLKEEGMSGAEIGAMLGVALNTLGGAYKGTRKKMAQSDTGKAAKEAQVYGEFGQDVFGSQAKGEAIEDALRSGVSLNDEVNAMRDAAGKLVARAAKGDVDPVDMARRFRWYRNYLANIKSDKPEVQAQIQKLQKVLDDFELGKQTKVLRDIPGKKGKGDALKEAHRIKQIEAEAKGVNPDDVELLAMQDPDHPDRLIGMIRVARRSKKTGEVTGYSTQRATSFDPNESNLKQKLVTVRQGGKGSNPTAEELVGLKQDFQSYTPKGDDALKSNEAKAKALAVTKNLDKVLSNRNPELKQANQLYNTVNEAMSKLNLDAKADFHQALNKLGSRILVKEGEGVAGFKSKLAFEEFLNEVRKIDPRKAAALEEELFNKGVRVNLATGTDENVGFAMSSQGTPVARYGGPIASTGKMAGHAMGKANRAIKETFGRKVKDESEYFMPLEEYKKPVFSSQKDVQPRNFLLAKKLGEKDLKEVADILEYGGRKIVKIDGKEYVQASPATEAQIRLARIIRDMDNSNYRKRNATLFSLMQQPAYRDAIESNPVLKEELDKEDEKKK